MAANVEIESGLRESTWPDIQDDYGLNGRRAEGRQALASAEDGQHASKRSTASGWPEH